MKNISIIIFLMIGLSLLLLTGCQQVGITPEIDQGNSDNLVNSGSLEADKTKPIITGLRAPLPNALGWNNSDVTVSFSCEDVGPIQSGIETNTVTGMTLTTEGKDQSVTNTGVLIDAAGNTADPVTVSNINIDKTPPVVTITLPGTAEYVLNQSITATWSATDALSGVVSPDSGTVSINTSSVGTKTFTLPAGTAKDKAGNSSLIVTKPYSVIADTEESVTGEVDTTKPVITGSRDPLPNSLGWNNTDVAVSFSCVDTGAVQSGIDINTVAGMTLTTEGKDQSVTNTGECIDAAGNVADPVTVSNINIDKTPPVVIITLPKNGKYNLNESVTATWSATDALSGVKDSKAPKTININTKSKGKKNITLPAGLVEDEAGNSSEEVTVPYEVLKADVTKPVITGSRAPLPNSLGWNNTDVIVSFSCVDTGAVQSGIDINTVAGMTLTTEGKDQSVTNTGECIDAAGNVADPVTVSNINIDKTPPVVTITLPGNREYNKNESIIATWSTTDNLSGVVSPSSGTVLIDTSSIGIKTLTLPIGTAKDKAGNSSQKVTISYSVLTDMEDPAAYQEKWPGLGMVLFCGDKADLDTIINNGFTDLRIDIPDYDNSGWMSSSKNAVISAVSKGANVVWGVKPGGTITASNWSAFRTACINAAQWAQNNGVYEFQLGNEGEGQVDGTTLTMTQYIANVKSLATEVQAIFTNGNISYSTGQRNDYRAAWIAAGRGDIDIIALNTYMGGTYDSYDDAYQDRIDEYITAFGLAHTYLTEFSVSYTSLDDYSTNEAVQAAAITEMINYIKSTGIERAFFFCWKDDKWGVMDESGDYRLLWEQALLSTETVKFATVPTTTTTVSLSETIAFLPRITE